MSDFAHDLRGSVQVIAGYANLLAEGSESLEPEQLQYIERIKAGAKRVEGTIERAQARVDELVRRRAVRI